MLKQNFTEMRRIIVVLTIVLTTMPIALFGQTYSALWKKVKEAENKDLPKTQYEVLQEIVKKATKENAYGQLLKAELQGIQVMMGVAPDSLKPAVDKVVQRCEATKDPVLKTVYQTVLYRVYSDNSSLGIIPQKPVLDETLCKQLAQARDESYTPFVLYGSGSGIFNRDMLSVIGFELKDYEPLYRYYQQAGNRQAACVVAAKAVPERYLQNREDRIQTLDSLMNEYGDLPEAGELAVARYQLSSYEMTAEEKIRYIKESLDKWGSWGRTNVLRNAENELTNPQFTVRYDHNVNLPGQSMLIQLENLRHLSSLTLTVYPVKAGGDIDIFPGTEYGYKKIKPLLSKPVVKTEKVFTGKQSYDIFNDSLTLESLPVGLYMLEFSSSPSTEVIRHLYFVTDLYLLAESQPDGNMRYAVVNGTTGQPVANAQLRITEHISYNKTNVVNVKTNAKGEYLLDRERNLRYDVYAYTDYDKACPEMNSSNQYRYYSDVKVAQRTAILTDRAIYRPGQTVHAAVMVYDVEDGYKHRATVGKSVTMTLRDANRKELKKIDGQTDKYGMCSADFVLPASVLTGNFTIQANGQTLSFRVEEYKRPTFEVEFPEVKQHYEAGDTVQVRATARSYAGVPVQGATVKYKVVRRLAFWWWSYWRYYDSAYIGSGYNDEEISSGETVTGDDGTFLVEMPMILPESDHPLFYNFIVTADVTDTAGETHSGQLSLPLGNRKTALSVDLEEKILMDSQPTMTFHLRNAAGKDIDAEVKYRFDEGKWQTAKANSPVKLPKLASGRYHLTASSLHMEGSGEAPIERDFVVFSLDDIRPATQTDDWFYQSATQFPNNGQPVTIQVGSSDKDVHIFYSLFAGEQIIETGAVDKSNELINRKFTYKEEYGNGLLLNFAWVKNGQCYKHTARIQRPLPDKKLKLQWTTFRDRLTPGQQEEWTLTVLTPDGKPADAMMTATLYDKSLDQIAAHYWGFSPYIWLPIPDTEWSYYARYGKAGTANLSWGRLPSQELVVSHFDSSVFPFWRNIHIRGSRNRAYMALGGTAVESAPMMVSKAVVSEDMEDAAVPAEMEAKETAEQVAAPEEELEGGQVQIRENLNETAFFYPQLTTDEKGRVVLQFTLPESLTTWRFMGFAHTKDICYGMLEGETVAKKDVMIQPNMPRFIREGDQATITARIFNTGEKQVEGKAILRLKDPVTDKIVYEQSQPFTLDVNATTTASFHLSSLGSDISPLICQVVATGIGFSDGEQHYLPVLPSTERVTVTVPFTQIEPGTKTIDLSSLIPADGKNGKMTIEYTNNPVWLMIQALPTVGKPIDDNVISQTASYYANSIGQFVITQNPQAKTAFELWQQEADQSSLTSQLEKNQELKDIILGETPWVMDADKENEQKQRLADFFDENTMRNRLSSSLEKMKNLQHTDGSWSWWPEMRGSFYMTVAVSEMLVRLNSLTGTKVETRAMLDNAFSFMGEEIIEEVKEMKKWAKKGHKVYFPSFKALQWLYLCTLDGRTLPAKVQEANNYLIPLLKKDIKSQTIYEKAMTAVILSKVDARRSLEYVKSLKEYTVYQEEMGRYYDTPRAGYSWYDYRIPTQTMAIEALQRLTPEDQQTILEMQRWLLQSKRTQAWDTPINSVNAVYAFMNGNSHLMTVDNQLSTLQVDGKELETPKATAAIGYVKALLPDTSAKTLTVDKTSEGTSWGAVYAQFTQSTSDIVDTGSGLTVKREILIKNNSQFSPLTSQLSVGDRVVIRITIEAERDFDFVQVLDKRAACLEPVKQLSGYHQGSYCTPRDYSTNYYFDFLSKGKHVIESEYYIDRPGTYETGTCTVQCAYAPEFRGTTKSQILNVKQ
jgi:hypothetical protein